MVLLLATCRSKPKIAEDAPVEQADLSVVTNETIIIEDGENSQPSYSANGDRLLFVSAKRPGHMQRQVYERDFSTQLERRVTFQNGSTWNPHYTQQGDAIVYASSTDEEKENPPLLTLALQASNKPTKLPELYTQPLEIYLHSLSGGLAIERLTSRPGFDGEPHLSPDGRSISFTRVYKERSQVLTMSLASHAVHALPGLGDNPTDLVYSLDGKSMAWIEWDQAWGVSRLRLKRGVEAMDVAPDMIVTKATPAFAPDSRFLLWSQKDPQSGLNGIWSFELKTNCLQRFVFRDDADRSDPVVSPDMKWLTYTLVRQGRSRIAKVPFVQRTGPCPVIP